MKVPNHTPYSRLENQLPRDLRNLPLVEPEERMHLGDAAVFVVVVLGLIGAVLGLY